MKQIGILILLLCTLISHSAGDTGFSDSVLVEATPLDGIWGKDYTESLPVFLETDTPFDGGEAVNIDIQILESPLPIQVSLIFYKEYSLLYNYGEATTTDLKVYTSTFLLQNSQFNVNINWVDYLDRAFNITKDLLGYRGYRTVDSLRVAFNCKCDYWNTTVIAQISVKSEVSTHPNEGMVVDESGIIPYVELVSSSELPSSNTTRSEFNPIVVFVVLPIMTYLNRRKS